jgi:nanoRNase/pAp phosphatase (c-di-AMP/oligoRNAs hydrolase)
MATRRSSRSPACLLARRQTPAERSAERADVFARLDKITKDQRWCILISADPDAMASALALKRILFQRTRWIDVCRINQVTRPDNLAMIRHLRLAIKEWKPEMQANYTHFAIVDGQPHHSRIFAGIPFDIVIDHHPLPRPDQRPAHTPAFEDIRTDCGATSTILTSYLRLLRLRPSAKLATALLLGIRTDTMAFERSGGEEDLDAYQWLSLRADQNLVRRIVRSEYLRPWLPLFAEAFHSLSDVRGSGAFAWVGDVDSADVLVAIADFFTRIHGFKWIAVSGAVEETCVVIFRSDGSRDIGRLSDACFHDVGSAGGHKTLGRAEFPVSAIPSGASLQDFILQRLQTRKLRSVSKPAPQEA